ncbi:SGNH/GDSL hydrolase family protein [Mesorhizobium sp. M0199]|uniref:SGNH/GDSL hydrolase family protein n=1 Tax=Mesorhizobium sp. M0199 TaxID=2956911 RepID=UPI00333714C3
MMSPQRKIVACLGSSSTAGKGQAFDWIAELRRRPGYGQFEFRNFGVGGDLAYNALQRLPDVLACRPGKVIVWVGGNDVLALVSRKVRRFFSLWKRLSRTPSPDWLHENLAETARRLKRGTAADIGLCSLPPIGEAPDSDDPVQSELNRRIKEYSAIWRPSRTRNAAAMSRSMRRSPRRFAPRLAGPTRRSTFLPFYRDAFRVLVLRQRPDDVARVNGWLFHTDGVHLNSRAGLIVADRLQKFVQA